MSARSDVLGKLTTALLSGSVTAACIGTQPVPPPVVLEVQHFPFQAYADNITGHDPAPAGGGVNPLLVPILEAQ
jgi:hypothetical protein